jgi:hypothetical protein
MPAPSRNLPAVYGQATTCPHCCSPAGVSFPQDARVWTSEGNEVCWEMLCRRCGKRWMFCSDEV